MADHTDEATIGCFIGLVLLNVAWLSFVGYLIYLLVSWITSK